MFRTTAEYQEENGESCQLLGCVSLENTQKNAVQFMKGGETEMT